MTDIKQPISNATFRAGDDDKAVIMGYINGFDGESQPVGAAHLAEMIRTYAFRETHQESSDLLNHLDSLYHKMLDTTTVLIDAADTKAKDAAAMVDEHRARADKLAKDISAKQDEVDAAKARIKELEGAIEDHKKIAAANASEVEAIQKRIASYELKEADLNEREIQAEADRVARTEAEKGRAIAEKEKAEALAQAEAARADLVAAKKDAAAKAEVEAAKATAAIKAAEREAEVARSLAEKEIATAKENAAKSDGRAEALAADVARIRDERNQARADLAAAQAEAKAKDEQISMLKRFLQLENDTAVKGVDKEE